MLRLSFVSRTPAHKLGMRETTVSQLPKQVPTTLAGHFSESWRWVRLIAHMNSKRSHLYILFCSNISGYIFKSHCSRMKTKNVDLGFLSEGQIVCLFLGCLKTNLKLWDIYSNLPNKRPGRLLILRFLSWGSISVWGSFICLSGV